MSVNHSWPCSHFPPNFPICIRRYLCWLERCVSRRPLLCNLRQYSCKVVKSLKDCVMRTVGQPAPLTRFRISALHSCPQAPIQSTFLWEPTPISVGWMVFFGDHSFSSSGFKLARSLIPATILALLQIGQFSPLDLAFALACHSWPQLPSTNIGF